MKFLALVYKIEHPENSSHIRTDRHFSKIVKLSSRHSKNANLKKKQKSEIATIAIFFLVYIEEINNGYVEEYLQCF